MRLQEFISQEEWQQLEQMVFNATWKALTMYQQQRAAQQAVIHKPAAKPVARLKPSVAKRVKSLPKRHKPVPYAAPPKPLPKPVPQPQARPAVTTAYRPVKTTKPLPPPTRATVASSRPLPPPPKPIPKNTKLPNSLKPLPTSVYSPINPNIDKSSGR
jgi:hypothetical protein